MGNNPIRNANQQPSTIFELKRNFVFITTCVMHDVDVASLVFVCGSVVDACFP